MEREKDTQRDEVVERIPWETLEQPVRDNNKMVMGLAAAVVVGALAFSFVRNQPVAPPVTQPAPVATPTAPAETVRPPILRSEADLYAVDHDSLKTSAVAHAEWFAVEYYTVDGSGQSALEGLLPGGVPLPQAPADTEVFVDWVGAVAVQEVGALRFEVEVLVRSMAASGSGGFVRQSPVRALVDVSIGDDGRPRVLRPPVVLSEQPPTPAVLGLSEVPDPLNAEVEAVYGPVVGGEPLSDGRWRVVVMVTDPDGVTRPRTVVVP